VILALFCGIPFGLFPIIFCEEFYSIMPSNRSLIDFLYSLWLPITTSFLPLGIPVLIASWYLTKQILFNFHNIDGNGNDNHVYNLFDLYKVVILLLVGDLYVYLNHRYLGHASIAHKNSVIRWFANNHYAHHQIEKLDLIAGFDGNLFELSFTVYNIPFGIMGYLLSLNVSLTLIGYITILLMQASHHCNYNSNIGILKEIFMDAHCHKLHHCYGKNGKHCNYAVLFTFWDRIGGTFYSNWNISPDHYFKYKKILDFK